MAVSRIRILEFVATDRRSATRRDLAQLDYISQGRPERPIVSAAKLIVEAACTVLHIALSCKERNVSRF